MRRVRSSRRSCSRASARTSRRVNRVGATTPVAGSANGTTAPWTSGKLCSHVSSWTTTGTTSGTGTSGQSTSGSGQSTGSSESSTPTLTYFTYTVDVRFGKADQLDKKRLERFRALPSSEDPVVVFMGVKNDGKTAVFLVSSATGTTGEGNCEPDDTCTFLYMKEDEQQSFEAVDANNQVFMSKSLEGKLQRTGPPTNGI